MDFRKCSHFFWWARKAFILFLIIFNLRDKLAIYNFVGTESSETEKRWYLDTLSAFREPEVDMDFRVVRILPSERVNLLKRSAFVYFLIAQILRISCHSLRWTMRWSGSSVPSTTTWDLFSNNLQSEHVHSIRNRKNMFAPFPFLSSHWSQTPKSIDNRLETSSNTMFLAWLISSEYFLFFIMHRVRISN